MAHREASVRTVWSMKQASKTPGIDIAGSGSLGAFFAHLLRHRGHDIRWLTHRPEQAPRQVGVEGLNITPLATEPSEIHILSYDQWTPDPDRILLMASRADLTHALLRTLPQKEAPLPETWVACNGLGLLDGVSPKAFRLGLRRLLCGFGIRELTPGRYRFAGPGSAEWADATPGLQGASETPLSAHWILEALHEIGVQLSNAPSVASAEWRKAAWNASMNAPLALAGLKNGALLETPEIRATFLKLLEEIQLVARAEGIELNPEGKLQERIENSIRATANNLNSMAAALARGLPTEIDWMNGAIVRLADEYGIPVPENLRMVRAIHARERQILGSKN